MLSLCNLFFLSIDTFSDPDFSLSRDFTRDEYYMLRVASLETVALKSLHLIVSNNMYMEKLLVPKASIYTTPNKEDGQSDAKNKSESETISCQKELGHVQVEEGRLYVSVCV